MTPAEKNVMERMPIGKRTLARVGIKSLLHDELHKLARRQRHAQHCAVHVALRGSFSHAQGGGSLKVFQLANDVGGDLVGRHGPPENEHDLA